MHGGGAAARRRVSYLDAREHAPDVGAVVAVVEEGYIPPRIERVEERDKCARPLGELETVDELVSHRRTPAGEVSHVKLRVTDCSHNSNTARRRCMAQYGPL